MNVKLTLRLDQSLIQTAKKEAHLRGKSVSQMVSDYFLAFRLESSAKRKRAALSPIVSSWLGSWKGKKSGTIGLKDYYKHLEEKYR